jgi:hypothetical protein
LQVRLSKKSKAVSPQRTKTTVAHLLATFLPLCYTTSNPRACDAVWRSDTFRAPAAAHYGSRRYRSTEAQ